MIAFNWVSASWNFPVFASIDNEDDFVMILSFISGAKPRMEKDNMILPCLSRWSIELCHKLILSLILGSPGLCW